MKKLFLLSTLALLTSGCAAPQWKHIAIYEKGFKQVLVDGKAQSLNPDLPLTFKNESIKVSFKPERFGVFIELENLTNKSIKLVWSDSVIYSDHKPLPIEPSEALSYASSTTGELVTLIPSGSLLKQAVVPVRDTHDFVNANASLHSLFLKKATKEKKSEFYKYVNEKRQSDIYDLMLTLEIEGVKQEYFFDFYIPNVKVIDL